MAQDSIQSYSACEQNAGYATRNKKSYNTSKDLRVLGTIGIIRVVDYSTIFVRNSLRNSNICGRPSSSNGIRV